MPKDWYERRISTQRRLTALNLLAALINFGAFATTPNLWTTINIAMGCFSLWVTWTCIRDIRRTQQERSEAINRILRTDFG